MDILTGITAGISSTTSVLKLVSSIKELSDDSKVNTIMIEVQNNIIDLQQKLLDTQQSANRVLEERSTLKRDLEEEVNKNCLLQNYLLVEPRSGIFLYQYQPIEGDDTPVHYACPNCFGGKVISILQSPETESKRISCPKCEFSYDSRTKEEVEEDDRRFNQMVSDSQTLRF
ncbi:hypothetical protein [Rubritalea tangerina]|uniref:Uncharacterized protein n=1 Tax=Rubritalea tangerina TaxID=430798 RepID=A0ABW4Z8S2_9BACT